MKRLLPLLLMVTLFVPGLFAANNLGELQVYLYDGSITTLRLSDNPEITFAGSDVTFLGNNIDLTVPFTSVQGIIFRENNTLTGVSLFQSDNSIRVVDKTLHITNYLVGASFSVYSINGTLLKRIDNIPEGTTVITLSFLPTGIYIVNFNNHSLTINLHD